jgi:hypothetical protein
MNSRQIIRNAIKCKKCGFILESHYNHDYVEHVCGEVRLVVDGGHDYIRRSSNTEDYEVLDVYDDEPFEVIREALMRGTTDKEGKRIYKKLSEMSNDHVAACITYNTERDFGNSYITNFYRQELEYRKEHGILIEETK